MAKVYLGFQQIVDGKKLTYDIHRISTVFEDLGHDVFCRFWYQDRLAEMMIPTERILKSCYKKIDESDLFLAYYSSDNESWMLNFEILRASKVKTPVLVAIPRNLDPENFAMAKENCILYDSAINLYNQLESALSTRVFTSGSH